MQPDEQKTDEIFDATIETEKIVQDSPSEQIQLDDARIRAEHQNMVTANLVDDIISQKKKSFRRTVVFSVSSVVILLILAIVFFVYLRWYAVGVGVAILTFAVAQIWLHFFKKWNYNATADDDFFDDFDTPEQHSQEPKQPETASNSDANDPAIPNENDKPASESPTQNNPTDK